MSASSSPQPPHRIGILMSPRGRFLECSSCHLSFNFPDGAQSGAIAKQFESHLCDSPIRIPSWRSEVSAKAPQGTERRIVIVRYEG